MDIHGTSKPKNELETLNGLCLSSMYTPNVYILFCFQEILNRHALQLAQIDPDVNPGMLSLFFVWHCFQSTLCLQTLTKWLILIKKNPGLSISSPITTILGCRLSAVI